MTTSRRPDRRSAEARRRSRSPRLSGLACLATAAGLAFLQDALAKLPVDRITQAGEQITLAGMLVLGMLGGLLLAEGRRLFDGFGARTTERGRGPVGETRSPPLEPMGDGMAGPDVPALLDSGALDTRSGVAMVLARRAILAAGKPRGSDVSRPSAGQVG